MPDRVGPFEVLAELGRGSAGVVYKVTKPPEQRPLALKVLFPSALEATGGLTRFRREAKALLTLNHPGIVRVYETGSTAKGMPYIALEFEPGGSLQERLRRGPLPVAQAVAIARGLSEAVAHAHDHGILHRDLKPHNVLFDAQDQPRITDFGLARAVGRDERITKTGEMLGTPTYMPPEQVQGDPTLIGPASDIYSLGSVLYAMLCGQSPFQGNTVVDILKAVINDPAPSPRVLRPEVDAALEAIVLRCLAKAPADRYPDARSLARDLASWGHQPAVAPAAPATPGTPAIPATPASAPAANWGLRFALAGMALMVSAVAVVVGWAATRSPDPTPSAAASVTDGPLPAPTPAPSSPAPTSGAAPTPQSEVEKREAASREAAVAKELLASGELQKALQAADAAVRLHRDVETLTVRVEVCARAGRYVKALEDCDALVALQPKDVGVLVDRGNVKSLMKKWRGARADYERALKLEPNHPRALAAMGWSLLELEQDLEGAERVWRASVQAKPMALALAGLAWVANRRGLHRECLERAAEALAIDPREIRALEARAVALLRLARFPEACDAFEKLAERRPNNVRWQTTSLQLAWKLKDKRQVLARLERVLRRIPKDHPKRRALVELEQSFRNTLAKDDERR